MPVRNHQFWIFYFAAWTIYAICLGGVFLSVGNRLDFNLPLTILCNVAPGALLGALIVQICRRLQRSESRRLLRFVSVHALLLLSFAFLWCLANLFFLSIFNSARRGVRFAFGLDNYGKTLMPEIQYFYDNKIFDALTLLKIAVETTPQAIFPNRRIGKLKENHEANFLVLNGQSFDRF